MSEYGPSGSVEEWMGENDQVNGRDRDLYGEEYQEKKPRVFGGKNYGIASIILGFALFGASLPLVSDLENYNNLKSPLAEVQTPIAAKMNLPFFILVCGLFILVGGSISLCGYYKNSKFSVSMAVCLNLFCCGLTILFAFDTLRTLESLLVRLSSNPITDKKYTDLEVGVTDFIGAVFNECCMTQYDSLNYLALGRANRDPESGEVLDDNQREVPECIFSDNVLDTCPAEMFPQIVNDALQGLDSDVFNNLLCHCVSNVEMYDTFINIFRRDDTCNKFRNVIIYEPDDRVLPVVDQTFAQLVGLLGLSRPELARELPIRKFALVGKFLPPDQVYEEPAESIGWSCGMGYAKNLAQYMYLFVSDRTKPLVVGGMIIGFLEAALSLFLVLLWFCDYMSPQSEENEYDDEEIYGKPVKRGSAIANVARKASKVFGTGRKTNPNTQRRISSAAKRKPSAATQPVREVDVDGQSANPSEGLSSLLGHSSIAQNQNRRSVEVPKRTSVQLTASPGPVSPAAGTRVSQRNVNLDDHL